MNIKRSAHIALATIVTTVGLSSPAMAFGPGPASTKISNGPSKPSVAMTHAEWKKCWSITYAQWRESGSSPANSQTAADWTCGTQP